MSDNYFGSHPSPDFDVDGYYESLAYGRYFESQQQQVDVDLSVGDRLQLLRECLGDNYLQLIAPGVKERDANYLNQGPQFPGCPQTDDNGDYEVNVALPGGWMYEDYIPDENHTGLLRTGVKPIRSVPFGMPLSMGSDEHNPGRLIRLPSMAVSQITLEPKKFLWVHPWLEGGDGSGDDEIDEEGAPISIFAGQSKWQSGPINNDINAEEAYYEAGLESGPGQMGAHGEFNSSPTNIRWKTHKQDKKWCYNLGNSRGKNSAGYPDEKTEGMEYGAIGVSGWLHSFYNRGRDGSSHSNAGVKFLYLMGRINTSIGELAANIEALIDLIDSIIGGGYNSDAFGWDVSGTLKALKLFRSHDDTIRDSDKQSFRSHLKNLREFVDRCRNLDKDTLYGWNLTEMYDEGTFENWKKRKITYTPANCLAIELLCEVWCRHDDTNVNKKDWEVDWWMQGGYFNQRLKDEGELTHKDLVDFMLTRSHLKNDAWAEQIGYDIDFEAIAKADKGIIPEEDVRAARFILSVINDYNVTGFSHVNNTLTAVLENNFLLSVSQWEAGYDGFFEACMECGGQFSINHDTVDCTSLNPDHDIIATYELQPGDRVDYYEYADKLDGIPPQITERSHKRGKEREANVGTYRPGELPTPDGLDMTPFPEANVNGYPGLLEPESSNDLRWAERGGRYNYACDGQRWEGVYCYPARNMSNPPEWYRYSKRIDEWGNTINNGEHNYIHTYGPWTQEEAVHMLYYLAEPRNAYELGWDYVFTLWASEDPYQDTRWAKMADAGGGGLAAAGGSRSRKYKKWRAFSLEKKAAWGAGPGNPIPPQRPLYFRISFSVWQEPGTSGGPGFYSWMFDPGRPGGRSNQGVKIPLVITPVTGSTPYDPEPVPEVDGPCYWTPNLNDPAGLWQGMEPARYQRPLNVETVDAGNWYKITRLTGNDLAEEYRDNAQPEFKVYQVSGDGFEEAATENDIVRNMEPDARVSQENETFIFAQTNRLLFLAEASDRNSYEQWGERGENWLKVEKQRRDAVKPGPGYWSCFDRGMGPGVTAWNFYHSRWQAPLTHWVKDAYPMDPRNSRLIAGRRYHIRALERPGTYVTAESYQVIFARNRQVLDRYQVENPQQEHDNNFQPVGPWLERTNTTGFYFTAPSDVMLFAANDTDRELSTWSVKGEEVQILITEERLTGSNANKEGPAYWAFNTGTDAGRIRGTRGYADLDDYYWDNPIRHYNQFRNGDDRFEAGVPILVTHTGSGDEGEWSYRVIYARRTADLSRNFRGAQRDTTVDTIDDLEFTDIIFRPGDVQVEFTPESDFVIFGAFKEGSQTGNPRKEEWSPKGHPVALFVEQITNPLEGPAYWAQNATTQPNWSLYERDINHFTQYNEVPGSVRRLIRGEAYKARLTNDTPPADGYFGMWVERQGLSNPTNNSFEIDPEIRLTPGQTVYFIAQTEYLVFGCTGGRDENGQIIPEDEWSVRGHPANILVEIDDTPPGYEDYILGKQYWTDDTFLPASQRHAALKEDHWDPTVLQAISTDGSQYLPRNREFTITIPDIPENPDHVHQVWVGPYPGAIDTTRNCNYNMGPALRKGESGRFRTDNDNICLVMGCHTTGRELEDWNPGGEPVYVLLEEYVEQPIKGSVYHGNDEYRDERVRNPKDVFAFPDPGRLDYRDEFDDPEIYYEEVNILGGVTDTHPTQVNGRRYRIIPRKPQSVDGYPDIDAADLPYDMRMWFARNNRALNPATSTIDDFRPGRLILKDAPYFDYTSEAPNTILGACNLPTNIVNPIDPTNRYPRDFFMWSKCGEPTHFSVDELEPCPEGPVYKQTRAGEFPDVLHMHFHKPLTLMSVTPGRKMKVIKPESYQQGNGATYQIWFTRDQNTDYRNSNVRRENGLMVDMECRHPEDMFQRGTSEIGNLWEEMYEAGPLIEPNTYPTTFTPPIGCQTMFFGEISSRDITTYSHRGDALPLGMNFTEYEIDPSNFGPAYWGETGPQWDNEFFLPDLNYIEVEPDSTYRVEKVAIDSLNEYSARIWAFNRALMPSPLDPSNNGGVQGYERWRNVFKDVGVITSTDQSIIINTNPGQTSLIIQAFAIQTDRRLYFETWSPLGERNPIKLTKIPTIKGPVYWADATPGPNEDRVWGNQNLPNTGNQGRGFPNFSNDHWEVLNREVITPGKDYEIEIVRQLKYDITIITYNDPKGSDPDQAQERMYNVRKTLKKNEWRVGDKLKVSYDAAKYVLYGASNIDPNQEDTPRDFERWSPKGHLSPLKWKPVNWTQGPGYPAHERLGGDWIWGSEF